MSEGVNESFDNTDLPNQNEEKKYRDELAHKLKEQRKENAEEFPIYPRAGRTLAEGRLLYEQKNNPLYDSAKKKHLAESRRNTEARARVLFVKEILDTTDFDDEKEIFEAFQALDVAIREGITFWMDIGSTLYTDMIEELDRSEYDMVGLEKYVKSLSEKIDGLLPYYLTIKESGRKDETGYCKYYASPRNGLTDYEKDSGLSMEERKEKLKQLIERFKIKK